MSLMPQPVTQADLAFGARDLKKLLPDWDQLPKEFRDRWSSHTGWCGFVSTWFYDGMKGVTMIPKKGIDPDMAMKHIGAILRSWEPSHEHKTAGCAYLLSIWFDDAVNEKKESVIVKD
jgi:hypothetical protein